jgi:hypothetical protein
MTTPDKIPPPNDHHYLGPKNKDPNNPDGEMVNYAYRGKNKPPKNGDFDPNDPNHREKIKNAHRGKS